MESSSKEIFTAARSPKDIYIDNFKKNTNLMPLFEKGYNVPCTMEYKQDK